MQSNTDNSDYTYKQNLILSGAFRKASGDRYTCQCPFCNDNKNHMYVYIKFDDTPLLYMCFKCHESGIVNKEFLSYLGLDDIRIPKSNKKFRKHIDFNKINQNIVTCNNDDDITDICNFINRKLGVIPTIEELQQFQYISNPFRYSTDYLDYHGNDYIFKHRHWFKLSNGCIIGRHDIDNQKINWLKHKSTNITRSGVYNIKTQFDLYKPINVYISEGVMDAIGLYYHYIHDNTIYIAVLGRGYGDGMKYLIDMGIFGDNVNIKIFKDSDVNCSYIHIDENMKKLFHSISIYENVIGKDYGLKKNEIEIQKCIL